jgi:hypothetical protein
MDEAVERRGANSTEHVWKHGYKIHDTVTGLLNVVKLSVCASKKYLGTE